MKALFFSILMVLATNFMALSQRGWVLQNSGVGINFSDVWFSDELNGWAVGESNQVVYTRDGGNTWLDKELSTFTGNKFWSVQFFDADHGWVSGIDAKLYHTTNGGDNWELIDMSPYYTFYTTRFCNSLVGWTAGWDGFILHTTDGGANWLPQNAGTVMELFDMWPVDENNCWITGQAGIILRTNDGGQSWTTLDAGTNHWTYGICFIDNLTGWIGTTGGTIHKTTDGGNSWQEQYDGDRSIMDIWFVNSMKGWATEGEFILFTDDGGTTWIRQPTGDQRELTRLCFIDDHTGWAVGVLGKIIFTTDGGAPVEDYSKPMLDVNVFPNPTSEKLNITLNIPQSGTLKINIYNGSGDLVEVLVNDKYTQGVYTLTYNIKLNNLPEGIYLYDITLNTSNQTYNLRDRFVVIY